MDKLIPTPIVHLYHSNVIDFDSQLRCWAGSAFDYIHYSGPRTGLDDLAVDLLGNKRRDQRCGSAGIFTSPQGGKAK